MKKQYYYLDLEAGLTHNRIFVVAKNYEKTMLLSRFRGWPHS